MIDLDRFKIVNDTWGHAAGDQVLVAVATQLQQLVDRSKIATPGVHGTVIRFGGDEFVLSLHAPGAIDRDDVYRQLDAIRSMEVDVGDGGRAWLSFSIGIAVSQGPTQLAEALTEADLDTYEDKAARARRYEDRRAKSATSLDIPPPSR